MLQENLDFRLFCIYHHGGDQTNNSGTTFYHLQKATLARLLCIFGIRIIHHSVLPTEFIFAHRTDIFYFLFYFPPSK
jgi:hypothetical protein